MKHFIILSVAFISGYICSAQNVGIGNSSPQGKLHIKGSADTSQLVIDAGSTQSNSRPLIRLRKNNGTDLLWIHSDDASNTFVGLSAGLSNIIGNGNTFLGSQAGVYNTNGTLNTATGNDALYSNTTGKYNTANGAGALKYNTTGISNTAVGVSAMLQNMTGDRNTAIGFTSMISADHGYSNTAVGFATLYYNINGSENTAIGSTALYRNTSGYYNTALGLEALFSNTTGHSNTATGVNALPNNTTGIFNTAAGRDALYTNTTGSYNTANGRFSLVANTTGEQNTAMGDETLANNSTGSFNTAIGLGSLYSTTISANNTMLGCRAGYYNDLGWNNTLIGANSNASASGIFNSIAIGESATATASSQARIGNSSVTSIGGFAGWSNVSDGRVKQNVQENVPGLSFIIKLRPVTYHLDLGAADRIMQKLPVKGIDGKIIATTSFQIEARKQKEQIVYTGFIAQDVEKAAKELGFDFSGVDAAKNDKDLYGLRYAEFVVPLVKAVQELSKENDNLRTNSAEQKKQNEALLKRIEKLESLLTSKN